MTSRRNTSRTYPPQQSSSKTLTSRISSSPPIPLPTAHFILLPPFLLHIIPLINASIFGLSTPMPNTFTIPILISSLHSTTLLPPPIIRPTKRTNPILIMSKTHQPQMRAVITRFPTAIIGIYDLACLFLRSDFAEGVVGIYFIIFFGNLRRGGARFDHDGFSSRYRFADDGSSRSRLFKVDA